MLKEYALLRTLVRVTKRVLILILMEHAQRGDYWRNPRQHQRFVLILILMEHAQRAHTR